MHNINYGYAANKNRLASVTATGLNSSSYSYDAIGNLKQDTGEGLVITWNATSKVKQVIKNGQLMMNLGYSATGQRQVKATNSATEYYIHDATGNVMCVYQQGNDTLTVTERPIYGNKRIGLLKQQSISNLPGHIVSQTAGTRHYELTDHLGNVVTALLDRKLVSINDEDTFHIPYVVFWTDYYPFGFPMPDRNWNAANYRFGFNGQEKDNEVYGEGKSYTAEFWQYDARLGRRWNVEPMAGEFPWMSTYVTFGNNPILKMDPNGEWDIDVHAYKDRERSGYALLILKDRNGNEVYRTVVKTIGIGGRVRNVQNSDTPQGRYKILGYRNTGDGTRYNRTSYGPNDLLALDYQDGEGGKRNGMHLHGGRQEGKYKGRKDLASTQGCMRINDNDILEIKNITNALEKNDPLETKGFLTLTDDLNSPVEYSDNRHNAGTNQFSLQDMLPPTIPSTYNFPNENLAPADNTRVNIPYKLPDNENK